MPVLFVSYILAYIDRINIGFAALKMNADLTAGHLISWAGLCPRNDESAGKRRSTRLRKGAPWLKTTLVQCAWAAESMRISGVRGDGGEDRQ